MKYKIGDKVRVREDLDVSKVYGEYFFVSLMAKQMGKVVEIKDVGNDSYSIKGDIHYWSEEMFSGLAEEPKNLIPLIAKELGVEMGEEFKISNKPDVYKFTDKPNVYKFTEDGLIGIDGNHTYIASMTFLELINGDWKIEKLPKKQKLTEDEKAILRNIPKIYKYIARDYSGELYVYENKPKKNGDKWVRAGNDYFNNLNLLQRLFQFIKWEDNEPYNIEELLEEYENLRSE